MDSSFDIVPSQNGEGRRREKILCGILEFEPRNGFWDLHSWSLLFFSFLFFCLIGEKILSIEREKIIVTQIIIKLGLGNVFLIGQ